jgi:hypothetical protein
MKATLLIATCALFTGAVSAQVYVKPHVTKDGTYVQGYQRTAPNETKVDNYSSQGNVNPYTGQQGRVDPYAQPNPYQQPHQPTYGQQQCGTNSMGQYVCR